VITHLWHLYLQYKRLIIIKTIFVFDIPHPPFSLNIQKYELLLINIQSRFKVSKIYIIIYVFWQHKC